MMMAGVARAVTRQPLLSFARIATTGTSLRQAHAVGLTTARRMRVSWFPRLARQHDHEHMLVLPKFNSCASNSYVLEDVEIVLVFPTRKELFEYKEKKGEEVASPQLIRDPRFSARAHRHLPVDTVLARTPRCACTPVCPGRWRWRDGRAATAGRAHAAPLPVAGSVAAGSPALGGAPAPPLRRGRAVAPPLAWRPAGRGWGPPHPPWSVAPRRLSPRLGDEFDSSPVISPRPLCTPSPLPLSTHLPPTLTSNRQPFPDASLPLTPTPFPFRTHRLSLAAFWRPPLSLARPFHHRFPPFFPCARPTPAPRTCPPPRVAGCCRGGRAARHPPTGGEGVGGAVALPRRS